MNPPTTTSARALSDERIKQLWVEHGLDECDPEGFARVIEAEVLSALADREQAGAVAQPNAAPGDGQRAVSLPTYGTLPWKTVRAYVEAAVGSAPRIDSECFIGHQIVGINFNSLNRIMSALAAPSAGHEKAGAVAAKKPCTDCGGSGMDGDAGDDGRCITVDCPACRGTGLARTSKVLSEDESQPFYDLAWEHAAKARNSFDGDELESLTFAPTDFETFCAALSLTASGAATAAGQIDTLNGELIAILGRPNFTCIRMAQELRSCGVEIKTKADHEQAAVIHFLLMRYLRHGSDWARHSVADLRAMLDQAEAKNNAAMSTPLEPSGEGAK